VLLGPPGSGKGTLAASLEQELAVGHLSTGELFRREIAGGTPLGDAVRRYVTQGRLVPDDVVVRVMTRRLTAQRLRKGFVLDGFPRTVGQAQGLDEFLARRRHPLDGAVYLACPPSVLIVRLSGRRVCSRCGANYHLRTMPPRRAGVCDRCGRRLTIRKDDQVGTISKRLAIDRTQAKPLLAYYRRRRLLYRLDASGSSAQVFRRAVRLFARQGWRVA
jgi:adenylate kinase